jgi:hypothetical protein
MDGHLAIREKIALAERLRDAYRKELDSDPELAGLLCSYRKAVEESWRLMHKGKIPEICYNCATREPGGGCCGQGVDEWYDPYLLLMNLLMGTGLKKERTFRDCCIFLGDSGCTLKARYHFCVNYLCSRITGAMEPEELEALRATYGRELYLSWLIERRLMEIIPDPQDVTG